MTSDVTSSRMPGTFLYEKKLNDFLILYVLSITLYCIFCDILLHQGDLSTRPLLARWVFWDAGVWMEAKKSPKHDVLLVRKVLHRSEEQCVTLKVWGAKAGSRGNVEEDRRLHRLWLDRGRDPGSRHIRGLEDDWTSSRWHFLETERPHEVWKLPEVQFIERKVSKLVRSFPEGWDAECFLKF